MCRKYHCQVFHMQLTNSKWHFVGTFFLPYSWTDIQFYRDRPHSHLNTRTHGREGRGGQLFTPLIPMSSTFNKKIPRILTEIWFALSKFRRTKSWLRICTHIHNSRKFPTHFRLLVLTIQNRDISKKLDHLFLGFLSFVWLTIAKFLIFIVWHQTPRVLSL